MPRVVFGALAQQTGRASLRRIRAEVAEAPNVDLLVRRLIERGLVYLGASFAEIYRLPIRPRSTRWLEWGGPGCATPASASAEH